MSRSSPDAGAAGALLPGGRVPDVGQLVTHPQLAATIRTLALDPSSLYSGSLAERAVELLQKNGAPFSGDEWLAGLEVPAEPAVSHSYQGHDIHVTPQPTPGWMVLQQAAICDGWLAGLPWLDAESVHVLASAARIAFADRYLNCGSDNDGWGATLEAAAVKAARDRIAFGQVVTRNIGIPDGDTTTTVAVDSEGRAVSFVHSLAFTFGACITIPGTGVLLNNRLGRGAYLIPGHPNEVHPRRRPLHTLNAWIATDAAGRLRHVGKFPVAMARSSGTCSWCLIWSTTAWTRNGPSMRHGSRFPRRRRRRPRQPGGAPLRVAVGDDALRGLGCRGHDVPWRDLGGRGSARSSRWTGTGLSPRRGGLTPGGVALGA